VAAINGIYCVAQILCAVIYDSLAMMSDGFHTLSDVYVSRPAARPHRPRTLARTTHTVVSLVWFIPVRRFAVLVALYAEGKKNERSSPEMSYGWKRAEVIGGMINGVALLTLCFYIVIDSLPRFIRPPSIQIGWVYIAVAASGIPINLLAAAAIACGSGTGDIQVMHAHSHGPDGVCPSQAGKAKEAGAGGGGGGHGHSHGGAPCGGHGGHGGGPPPPPEKASTSEHAQNTERNLNMWAVFLHSISDAFAALFVCTSGLLIHYYRDPSCYIGEGVSCRSQSLFSVFFSDTSMTGGGTGAGHGNITNSTAGGGGSHVRQCVADCACSWIDFADPIASLLLVTAMAKSTLPFLKETMHILLEGTPKNINTRAIEREVRGAGTAGHSS
jgi:Co/Zn/Cd efflux system component